MIKNKPTYRKNKEPVGLVLGAAGLGGVWGPIDPEESVDTILYALENGIITAVADADKKGIILHCDQSVPLEHVVKVMDIANRNKFELVLATRTK